MVVVFSSSSSAVLWIEIAEDAIRNPTYARNVRLCDYTLRLYYYVPARVEEEEEISVSQTTKSVAV